MSSILDSPIREKTEEVAADCTLNASFIVAKIMNARIREKSFESLFDELYEQCFLLNILQNWYVATEAEKVEDKADEEKEAKEWLEEHENEEYDPKTFSGRIHERLLEEYKNPQEETEEENKIERFVTIIQTSPESITKEMKIEFVNIFPKVIHELGRWF